MYGYETSKNVNGIESANFQLPKMDGAKIPMVRDKRAGSSRKQAESSKGGAGSGRVVEVFHNGILRSIVFLDDLLTELALLTVNVDDLLLAKQGSYVVQDVVLAMCKEAGLSESSPRGTKSKPWVSEPYWHFKGKSIGLRGHLIPSGGPYSRWEK